MSTPEPDDTSASSWSNPERIHRYRERVFAERARLRGAFPEAVHHQQRVLEDLLEFNAGTEYGRAHGFGQIRTLRDFKRAVPIQDYAALAPWIDRAAAGEANVLSADKPAVFFTSSGSTGAHKKIPVTPRFMKTTFFPFFYAAWAPLIEDFPDILGRTDAVLNLKHDPLSAPPLTGSGQPHVGASQVDFGRWFGEPLSSEPGTEAPWATLPLEVAANAHLEKMYLRLRLAVQRDVRCVIGINPAMVAAIPYQLNLWWPRIVKEVRDGTLGGVPYAAPDPAEAARLERLASQPSGVRPRDVWPNMRALFLWTGGLASLYLPRIQTEFGAQVSALPAPAAASEGPVGVTLDRHPRAGSLVVTASVYEFVDADADLAPGVETIEQHELEVGRDYHVIFSHVGGLYRYAVGDVVRVVDRVDGVPRVEYAGRNTRSDAAGERLRDAQVIRAMATALDSTGLEARNAACRVQSTPAPDGPALHYEFAISGHAPWSRDAAQRFAARLDAALGDEAPGYRRARAGGRLQAASIRQLDRDAFHRDWHEAIRAGVRPTQVKDRLFRQDPDLWRRLTDTNMSPQSGGSR